MKFSQLTWLCSRENQSPQASPEKKKNHSTEIENSSLLMLSKCCGRIYCCKLKARRTKYMIISTAPQPEYKAPHTKVRGEGYSHASPE